MTVKEIPRPGGAPDGQPGGEQAGVPGSETGGDTDGETLVTAWAQAYTGELHGHRWPADPGTPSATVALLIDGAVHRYRLVCRPGTSRAARDRSGRYVYVPVLPHLGAERTGNHP